MSKSVFTLLFFMLSLYCLGAGLMEHFAVDRAWVYVGAPEFARVHHESGLGVLYAYVIPLAALTLGRVPLLWFRLPVISKNLVWAALACHGVTWLSSAFIQIPVQLQLDKASDATLLKHLIATDWLRVAALVLFALLVVRMIFQVKDAYRVAA